MKKILCAFLALTLTAGYAANAQQKIYNKYNMQLVIKGDGTFSVNEKCLKLLDGVKLEDMNVPYKGGHPISTKGVSDVVVDTVAYKSYPFYDLNLYICKAKSETKTPCVFFCHGGGWYAGDPSSMLKFAKWMAKYEGITTVDVQYSLAVEDGILLENAVQDYMDAIAYVQAHAEELNIDPTRLGFVGHSAGGHLSSVAAMKCPQSKALVSWAGVYDLNDCRTFSSQKKLDQPLNEMINRYTKGYDENYLAEYSPVNMIPSDHKIAVALFFGGCDVIVGENQARTFGPALEKAGHSVDMEYYRYYGHSMHKASDKCREIWQKTVTFLKNNL